MLVTARQLMQIKTLYGLSPREMEIVVLLLNGVDSNKEIADKLGVTVGTAKHYLHILFCKIRVNSKLKAVIQVTEKSRELDNS